LSHPEIVTHYKVGIPEKVGAEVEVSKRIHTGSYKQRVAFDRHTQYDLAAFVDGDLENYVALNCPRHGLFRVFWHRFAFDHSNHLSARNADL